MKIVVVGRGKVGRALARALAQTRHEVWSIASRSLPRRLRPDTDVIVLAVRDSALPEMVDRFAEAGRLPPRAVVLHVAGALGPDVLAPLSALCAGVAQAHPLLSFADRRVPATFRGAHLLVSGDAPAVRRASLMGRAIGMQPRSWPRLDPAAYHAAAALAAGGTAALIGAAAELLERAGAPAGDVFRALAPLVRSVADNVERLGLPAALTGPVRRGDVATVRAHLHAIARYLPEIVGIYSELGRLQLELSARLAEAAPAERVALARLLRSTPSARWRAPSRRRRT